MSGEHCRSCGDPLAPGAQFCGGCGVPVAESETLTPGAPGADIPTMTIAATELGGPGPDDPWDWEPRRRVLPWIAAVVAVAVIAVGIAVVVSSGDTHRSVASVARREGPIVMPWVLTFKAAGAMALLEREGIDAKQVIVRREPSATVGPGTVIRQVPRAGEQVDHDVFITVSRTPDKTPDFVGKSINSARATLSTLDVKLTVVDALTASASDGIILEQTPAAGTPFAKAVRLTVARTPIPTNLGDLTGTGSAPTPSDTATVAGTRYADGLVWNVSVCPGAAPMVANYDLGGHYRKLVATAGLSSDSQDPADQVLLNITVDGAVVETRNLDLQTPVAIDIDLTMRQKLALTFTPIGGGDPKCSTAHATLGHARLLSTAQIR